MFKQRTATRTRTTSRTASAHRAHGSTIFWVVLVIALIALLAFAIFATIMTAPPNPNATPPPTSAAPSNRAAPASEPSAQGAGSAKHSSEDAAVLRAQAELETLVDTLTQLSDRGEPLDQMLVTARRFVERYPQFAPGRAFYGQVFMLIEQYDSAIEQLRLSLELDAQQDAVYLLLGSLYMQIDQPEPAAAAFWQACELDPTNVSYRLHLAHAEMQQNKLSEARTTLLHVIRFAPETHQAYAALAGLYVQQNKTDLALTQIDKALEHTPDQAQMERAVYLRKKALVLRRINDPEASLLVLQSIAPSRRMRADVVEEMATCWAMLGKPERGAEQFETALSLNPTDEELIAGAITWHEKVGNARDAQAHRTTLEYLNPAHPALQ